MIKIVNGNILNAAENIICQQVNCQGVMGAGLAKQIKNKYPGVYKNYRSICMQYLLKGEPLLGEVIFGIFTNDDKTIANLCGQDKYGRDKQYTDYNALNKCFNNIFDTVTNENSALYDSSIAIPYEIGCGLAGGDWSIVYKIIEDVFKDYDVTIYKFK